MHEIVTLQFGQKANYLATHFWNIQESYFTYAPNTEPSIVDHDVHFRPGIGTDGSDTYTPRTLIYDLKGGFGTLKQLNALYDDVDDGSRSSSVWRDTGLTTIKQQPILQTTYQQNLDLGLPTGQLRASDVRYWSDFNRVYFHPRSIVQLSEYTLNDSIRPFENWAAGEDLWRDIDRQEGGILDRDVRLFAEECDAMQGFQIFAGVDDAWGGWTERYVDALRDEYGKKSIWVWGIEDENQVVREKAIARKASAARSLSSIGGLVDAYIRLSTRPGRLPSYVNNNVATEWETMALIATGLESVMLPTRLRAGNTRGATMSMLEQTLNTNEGQNVWELGLNVGSRPSQTDDYQGRTKEKSEDESENDDSVTYDTVFTPESSSLLPHAMGQSIPTSRRKHVFGQVDVYRNSSTTVSGMNRMIAVQPLNQDELLRRKYNEEAIVERYNIPLGFPRLDAYPANLFKLSEVTESIGDAVPLSAGLTTLSSTQHNIMELRDLVTRYNRGVAVDEREELYNGLTEIGQKYEFGWDSDVDSGED